MFLKEKKMEDYNADSSRADDWKLLREFRENP